MTERLLIIGGTITPYREVQNEHDRLLQKFLSGVEGPPSSGAGPKDRPTLWFDLESKYFPFKTASGLQHRATQDTVTGLAEIVLEQEASSVGITAEITTLDQVIDARWQLRDPRLFERYDMVALTTTYIPAMVIIPLIGALRIPSRVKLFVGGPGSYKLDNKDVAKLRFDYLLRTEAEGRFALMLRHARGEAIDLSKIPGLTWREGSAIKVADQELGYVDMNSLPTPDYTKLAAAWGGRVIYESARGCPYRCEFCDYPFLMGNKKFRYKSAEQIQIDWNNMNLFMGVKDILCLDSLFTFPPKRLRELCALLIESGLNKRLRWGCYARPNDMADRDIASHMREAGCEYVYVGFESGAQDVLDFMKKQCTVEDNQRAIETCRDVGIMCVGLFICGFPGETPEMFEKTRQLLKDTPPFMLSLVPWVPDLSEASRVPIMEQDRRDRFEMFFDNGALSKVTMYRKTTYRSPLSVPWGTYWRHKGMDLQDALDLIGSVQQDVFDGTIRSMSEELFLPRLLDDPLNLYQRLGQSRAVDFYVGLSQRAVAGRQNDFEAWSNQMGLRRELA